MPSSPLAVAWKNTASPWLHTAHRTVLVRGSVGSEATSCKICVRSPAAWWISFLYTQLFSAISWWSQLRQAYRRIFCSLSSFGYNMLLHSLQNFMVLMVAACGTLWKPLQRFYDSLLFFLRCPAVLKWRVLWRLKSGNFYTERVRNQPAIWFAIG